MFLLIRIVVLIKLLNKDVYLLHLIKAKTNSCFQDDIIYYILRP